MLRIAYMNIFAAIFKALSDETRLRIVRLLAGVPSSLCVCEIMDSLGESQYNISRHLAVLKASALVYEEKHGRWVFYSLSQPAGRFHHLIRRAVLALPRDLHSLDSERLRKRLTLRKNGECVVGMDSKEWRKMFPQVRTKQEHGREK